MELVYFCYHRGETQSAGQSSLMLLWEMYLVFNWIFSKSDNRGLPHSSSSVTGPAIMIRVMCLSHDTWIINSACCSILRSAQPVPSDKVQSDSKRSSMLQDVWQEIKPSQKPQINKSTSSVRKTWSCHFGPMLLFENSNSLPAYLWFSDACSPAWVWIIPSKHNRGLSAFSSN